METFKTIYLVRHGYTGHKYRDAFIGSTDVPLSVRGINQAKKTALLFKNFKGESFSSPMKRARQTAGQICMKNRSGYSIIPELAEVDFGELEKLDAGSVGKKYPGLIDKWLEYSGGFGFPGGESLNAFHKRVSSAGKQILGSSSDKILVTAHGGVIRALICFFLKLPFKHAALFSIRNASVTTIRVFDKRSVLYCVNDTAHLNPCQI